MDLSALFAWVLTKWFQPQWDATDFHDLVHRLVVEIGDKREPTVHLAVVLRKVVGRCSRESTSIQQVNY